MATQTLVVPGTPGLSTPTIQIFSSSGLATVAGHTSPVSATNNATNTSLYTADFTDVPAGDYVYVLVGDGVTQSTGIVSLLLATGNYLDRDLVNGARYGDTVVETKAAEDSTAARSKTITKG